jgi:hypothetical protein
VHFTWYPWAIDGAARWLKRAERQGGDGADVHEVRKALTHLVLDLGHETARKVGPTFIATETLYGLAAVPAAGTVRPL